MIPFRPDGAGRLRKVGPGMSSDRLHIPDGTGSFVPQADPRQVAAQMQAALLAQRTLKAVMGAVQQVCGPAPDDAVHPQVGLVADPHSTDGVVVRDQMGKFFVITAVTVEMASLPGDPFAPMPEPDTEPDTEDD